MEKPCIHCLDDKKELMNGIERLLARLENKEGTVDDLTYESRLSQCRSCSSLSDEETCTRCGCYVRVRAKMERSHCPHPQPRW